MNPSLDPHTPSLQSRFAQARAQGLRTRDAAHAIGATEGEVVAAHMAAQPPDFHLELSPPALIAWPLQPAWFELLSALHRCGPMMALTRNDACVHEKTAPYGPLHGGTRLGLVRHGDFGLCLSFERWKHGFLVAEGDRPAAAPARWSLQFFDEAGRALHKIFPTPQTDRQQWPRCLTPWLATGARPSFAAARPACPARACVAADAEALRRAWSAMTAPHEISGLLARLHISRHQALEALAGRYTRRLPPTALARALACAAAEGLALSIVVGNSGCTQIHRGPIGRPKPLTVRGQEWLNILDPTFNLHLRQDLLAQCWEVHKRCEGSWACTLEALDAQGDLILMVAVAPNAGPRAHARWCDALAQDTALDSAAAVAEAPTPSPSSGPTPQPAIA